MEEIDLAEDIEIWKVELSNENSAMCYINVIIQILLHCPKIRLLCVKTSGITDIDAFIQVLRLEYCTERGVDINAQCDATFFLSWILERLEKHGFGKEEWLQEYTTQSKCITCDTTATSHSQLETFKVLLPVEVEDNDFCTCWDNQQFHAGKCDTCGQEKEYQRYLSNIPLHLFVNLQNFHYQVNLPEELTFDFMGEPTGYGYALRGVVCHRGTHAFGHYFVLIKEGENWICYNDDTSYQLPLETHSDIDLWIESQDASTPLLWFERVETEE